MSKEEKKCSKCGEVKMLSEFYKQSTRKNYIYPHCKNV